jgi:F0F1-type ATP synthase membrane subunit b/b'
MVEPESAAPKNGAGAARYASARDLEDARAALSTATACAAKAQAEYSKMPIEAKKLASIAADAALEKAQAVVDALISGRKR